MIRFALLALLLAATAVRAEEPVRVFAAASLTDALTEAAAKWQAAGHAPPVLAFGASSALARQIDAGAPADVFLSADAGWMDHLQERGRIDPATRTPLLGNALVLVAPVGRAPAVRFERGFDFAGAFAGKLCLAEPGVVPAGIYAQQALEHLGWWTAVRTRLVGADDVRTALSFVERGECALGIVYATDARGSRKAVTVGEFPPAGHAPIVYPVALVRGARAGGVDFLAWLRGADAQAVFRRHGFTPPPA